MRRIVALVVGVVVATAVRASHAQGPVTLEQLKDQAAKDAATLDGKAYLARFFTNQWMVALDAADESCLSIRRSAEADEKLVIALSIGANGYPVAVLVSPEDKTMECIADRLKSSRLIEPPREGFAIYLAFEAVEPGSERERELRAAAAKPSTE
ncbi:MAG TPA: hypothetical protein VFV19_06905 [Candidatus Polarisedimenticolaceae bacterium]|nr:hypothetical protein [Candidatus Polarisedimenticolaceae bacterium]